MKKSGETMNGFITNKVRNNDTKSTTVTTTTEWPISVAQPTTVDIETLPGNKTAKPTMNLEIFFPLILDYYFDNRILVERPKPDPGIDWRRSAIPNGLPY